MNTGIVIQARLGSSRLPGKILLPFFGKQTILDILVAKLRLVSDKTIIATSERPENDALEEAVAEYGVLCSRGPEEDVLGRFIGAARSNGLDTVVRVCSDNPFLDLDSMRELLDAAERSAGRADYIGFNVGGTPSIKTHYGFWAECVTLAALEKAAAETDKPLYHEHVTNYIYTHPEGFRIEWLAVPEATVRHDRVRLTIDTAEDFENARRIYAALHEDGRYPSIDEVLAYLDAHPEHYDIMERQIRNNSK